MARITDTTKIERLKQSTMKLVVERGFGGASAMLIAKDAKVASGYFYMHYKGKYELVNSLLQDVYQEIIDWFKELIEKNSSFTITVEHLIHEFFGLAKSDPTKVKFLYVLTNDYSFALDQKIHDSNFNILKELKELGHKTGELDQNIQEDDLYLILIINTIQFINQRYKKDPKNLRLTRKDEKHLLYLINKTLT